jgi:hypothetical protein
MNIFGRVNLLKTFKHLNRNVFNKVIPLLRLLATLSFDVFLYRKVNSVNFDALPSVNVGITVEMRDPFDLIQSSYPFVKLPYSEGLSGEPRRTVRSPNCTRLLPFLDFDSYLSVSVVAVKVDFSETTCT